MPALSDQDVRFRHYLWNWRHSLVEKFHPPVRAMVLERVNELDQTDYVEANRFCCRITQSLARAHVGKAFSEDELGACADNFATVCARTRASDPREILARLSRIRPQRFPGDGGQELRAFAAKCAFASTVGLDVIPANRTMRFHGLSARLDDPLWWRRQLRKLWSRASEQALRELGLIRRGRDVYCSESAVRQRGDQVRRIRRFARDSIATNELGEVLELENILQRSLSNPAIRRGELMTRVRGFDELAQASGHAGLFVTLTCPSQYHVELMHGGRNPRYGDKTVREGQTWLSGVWSRIRARFAKNDYIVYGMRVAEPHHDGTPHWHCLLYADKKHCESVSNIVWDCALGQLPAESGAYQHRVAIEPINFSRGGGVGYLAKYISKNIDAQGVTAAEPSLETGVGVRDPNQGTGVDIHAGLQRVQAWASLHHIRQFQALGGPPVGLWRELRRLREPIEDGLLEPNRDAADRGDWHRFCINTHFPFKSTPQRRLLRQLWRHEGRGRLPSTCLQFWREETGRINRYGEACGAQIVGLKASSNEILTRPHRWKIERKQLGSGGGAPDIARVGSVLESPRSSLPARGLARLGPVALTVTPEWRRVLGDLDHARSLSAQMACQRTPETRPEVTYRWVIDSETGRPGLKFTKEYATGPPH